NIEREAAAAWAARAEGKNDEALKLMRAAADLEDSTEKHPVTPAPVVPARELLGEMLLDLNRPAQALVEFEASAAREPNRLNGMFGAARAAELSGNTAQAKVLYARLVALCARGDGERPELRHAKAVLAKGGVTGAGLSPAPVGCLALVHLLTSDLRSRARDGL